MIQIITTIVPSYTRISPIPRPPSVFALWYIQYGTWKWKRNKKQGKPGLISMWITPGGHEVDIGGEGPTTKTIHWIIRFSSLPQFWTSDVSSKLPALASKKLTFKLSSFEYRPLPPYIHLTSTHVMNELRPFPFCRSLLPCIILNVNRRTKNGGGLGTRQWKNLPNLLPLVMLLMLHTRNNTHTDSNKLVIFSGIG